MIDALEDEFDVVAAWTEQVVGELGPGYAIAAGLPRLRQSGEPGLAGRGAGGAGWPGRMLDAGSGVGGPAAWLARHAGLTPVCAEPMRAAARASRRLFGLPAVAAAGEALPFPAGTFDVAWCLGVLDTAGDRAGAAGRAAPGARPRTAGSACSPSSPPVRCRRRCPRATTSPPRPSWPSCCGGAGFQVLRTVPAGSLPDAPASWRARADAGRGRAGAPARGGSALGDRAGADCPGGQTDLGRASPPHPPARRGGLMRPFRFLAPIGDGVVDARTLVADARRAEDIGIDVLVRSDHLLEQHGPLAGARHRRRGDRAGPDRHLRPQRRPPPPGRAGPGAGQPGRAVRRPAGGRDGCRLEPARVRGDRRAVRPGADPGVPAGRGGRRCSRAASPTARSRTPASTTGSPTTTATRSRCSGRTRRCSSAAAAGGRSGWPPGRRTSSGWRRGRATRAA